MHRIAIDPSTQRTNLEDEDRRPMGNSKTLCNWSGEQIAKKRKKLCELVESPRFVCKKCARVANQKKVLCSPDALTREP